MHPNAKLQPKQKSQPKRIPEESRPYPHFSVFSKSVLASLLLSAVFGAGIYFSSGLVWPLSHSGDHVSDAQKMQRAEAFGATGHLKISAIPDSDIESAVSNMGLQADAQAALLQELKPTAPAAVQPAAPVDTTLSASPSPSAETTPSPAVAPQKASPAKLAWITLWDTDSEDGDIVRISSNGYTRTVTLRKAPVTIAVPVSSNGTIEVTGVRDGEGGGITVGIGSGAEQAVFPIMSVGQTLGLKVTLP